MSFPFLFLKILALFLFFTPDLFPQTYSRNPQVPEDVWTTLEPYFLPSHHPIKPKLDRLFSKRITRSKTTFEQAGFDKIQERQSTNIIVGFHPQLKGYLIKAYLDTQPPLCEWMNWLERIKGAEMIRSILKQNREFQRFKVPKKWIYPLPSPSKDLSSTAYHPKHFILVVEKMDILSHQENLKSYSKKIQKDTLTALYHILKEGGLLDSVYPDNIPFCRDGKIAFIDTEHHHKGPVPYEKLTPFLSPSMQRHWNQLISQN